MVVLKSCCCFTNVRSGSVACGVYSLVLSMISAGIVAYNLHLHQLMSGEVTAGPYLPSDMDAYRLDNISMSRAYFPGPNSTFIMGSHEADLESIGKEYLPSSNRSFVYGNNDMDDKTHVMIVHVIFLCALIVACLLFVFSIFLVAGVLSDKRLLLLPWMCVMVINVILDTGTMTYYTTLIGSLTFIIIEMVIWLLLTVLNIYCLLCVFSQYQELKYGRGTREYNHQYAASTRVSYRPNLQQVHINQGPIIINGILPQAITSSVHTTTLPQGGNHSQVTTTLLVQAPDYHIAAGQPPQYHEAAGGAADNKEPLLNSPPPPPPGQVHCSQGCDSPPPPYSSS